MNIDEIGMNALMPRATLRAAINLGNPILAIRGTEDGMPTGVSVDIATELAARLGVQLELVTYAAAGTVVEAAKSDEWDIAFVAIDPLRGLDMNYTAPYVVIEGAYMVREDSAIRDNLDVDRSGNRVVVGRGSAYDLFLTRTLTAAEIVRAATSPAVTDTMLAAGHEVAAGVKQQLQADARRLPGLRLLEGSFMAINQAMAMPKGQERAMPYLRHFVESLKASGFIALALDRHQIDGAAVAPPA